MGCAIHVKAMEVQTSGLVTQLILYIDNDSVSNGSCDVRNWPLAIDANGRAGKAIWLCGHPSDIEVISHGSSYCRGDEEEKRQQR